MCASCVAFSPMTDGSWHQVARRDRAACGTRRRANASRCWAAIPSRQRGGVQPRWPSTCAARLRPTDRCLGHSDRQPRSHSYRTYWSDPRAGVQRRWPSARIGQRGSEHSHLGWRLADAKFCNSPDMRNRAIAWPSAPMVSASSAGRDATDSILGRRVSSPGTKPRSSARSTNTTTKFGPSRSIPLSTQVAAAGLDPIVRVRDMTTGQMTGALSENTDVVFDLAFGPDGRHLATAGIDGLAPQPFVVKLWDARAVRQPLPSLLRRPREIFAIAFSPSGDRLALALADGTVELAGRVRTGLELGVFGKQDRDVHMRGLAFRS